MQVPGLPEDLVTFLRAGRRLEYDPALRLARLVTLLPARPLKVELFPMDALAVIRWQCYD